MNKLEKPFVEITSDNIENVVYLQNGYANRNEYLNCLADDGCLDIDTVKYVADLLGPNEDFDGLLTTLENIRDHYE